MTEEEKSNNPKWLSPKIEKMEYNTQVIKQYVLQGDPDVRGMTPFNSHADALIDGVVFLLMQGGLKTSEIRESMKYSLDKADGELAFLRKEIDKILDKHMKEEKNKSE
jgi:hypothetical protein